MAGPIPTRRRWFQFSLRTLLLLATVLCIWLGVWANRANRQRLAVQQIRQVSGEVWYEPRVEESFAPAWLRSLAGEDFFLHVVGVSLHCLREDRKIRPLSPAELDQAVAAMTRLPRLRTLRLQHTQLCDEDFARLAPLARQIEELDLNESNRMLDGNCIQHFSGWPRLRNLSIHSFMLQESALQTVPHIPKLEQLSWGGGELDAQAFARIGECRQLRHLGLSSCSFEGKSLAGLKGAVELKSITMNNIGVYPRRSSPGDPNGETAPAEYDFSPGDYDALDAACSSDPQYEEWLKQMLPGVEVLWMFLS